MAKKITNPTAKQKQYWDTLKQKRKSAMEQYRRNRKAAEADEEYRRYLKEYERIKREYKKKGIDVASGHTQGLWKAGRKYTGWKRGKLLSQEDYYAYQNKYSNLQSAEQVALEQYGFLKEDVVDQLYNKLAEHDMLNYNGTEITRDMIRARQLPQELWDKMRDMADAKYSGDDQAMSHFWFGS